MRRDETANARASDGSMFLKDEARLDDARDDRVRAGLALQLAAAATGTPPEAMVKRRLSPRACRARWLALYLAHVGHGWPLERVGLAFGVNRTTVGAACRWMEDARDRTEIDEGVTRLEALMRAAFARPVVLPAGAPS